MKERVFSYKGSYGEIVLYPSNEIHYSDGTAEVSGPVCGRWVFERPDADEMHYIVRNPQGFIFRDHGAGHWNVDGAIIAWLEMYPEPPPPESCQPI